MIFALGIVAEIVAFGILLYWERAIQKERNLLIREWEELAKQAEEVAEAATAIVDEAKRSRAMSIGFAEIYGPPAPPRTIN